ncbi:MAG: class 1 fructose-bisphosphatase [Pleurocapsa minor GSE-CHR-MK-17-07R]|jgi:fructose-1,6-bisphosphatase I|nr:class 1 fructose-bisphosphatase [Pleurocapsa minor GSE-CHR-MK 17-07R]
MSAMPLANITTIERHILDQQKRFPSATGEFTELLYDIALAAKMIARETTRAGLANILGESEGTNFYGERQQKLDVYADEVIMSLNEGTQRLCAMASEEHDDLIEIPTQFGLGKYVLLFDPLDGSSNIDVNVSVGTIFAIHRRVTPSGQGTMADVLQAGRRLVAAGYVIYGSSTMMVYSAGQGVHGFTLDPALGEFLLSHPDIRVPDTAKFYSANQGNERYWTDGVRGFTRWLQGMDPDDPRKPLSGRYIGSLVTDFHRNLLQGGVFYYPADSREGAPYGKMRLMFEAQAMAYLAQHAGAYASDGIGDILDVVPHSLHQRTPVFVGNRDLVERAEAFIRASDADWLETFGAYRARSAAGG